MQDRFARVVSNDRGVSGIDLFDESHRFSLNKGSPEPGSIVRYQSADGEATVSSVVAKADTALAAIWIALSENGVDPNFPEEVHREVDAIVARPEINDASIADLTHLPFITIDNVDSRDLDQAMHISRDNSQFILHYALADAAHFVKPKTDLFNEALRRGASYYVPGFAVPMLPRVLSEDLVSLNESVLRRAMVFTITFDADGAVLSTEVQQARIVSAAKLSYSGVEQYYKNAGQSDLAAQPFTSTLDCLRELGRLRIERARRRNVVEYDRSSVEIQLADNGRTLRLIDAERLSVEKYNEQISLICNAEGARLLSEAGLSSVVQAVYRVHEAPDEDRLIKFSRLLKGLIRHYQLDPALWVWRWRDGQFGLKENLSDYLQRLRDNDVNDALLAAVQRQALMLSPASRFSATPGGHHSLKVDHYARFSSPMREIAGIFTHREYLQLAGAAEDSNIDDSALREQVIKVANKAKEVQKRLNKAVMKVAIDQLFKSELELPLSERQQFNGTVMSLRPTRVYVQLDEPRISVKLYLRKLGEITGHQYALDRSAATIKSDGEVVFSVGQQLTLRAQSYSQNQHRWLLMPVETIA